jgi:LacI family transcriptional regulator
MSSIRRVTLSDVAKEAKVHVTTVSLALRDHPRIPAHTKQRIRDLARQMGYSPDPVLSALATYRLRSQSPRYQSNLAYLTNWVTETGWKKATGHLEFYTGAERMAAELGFKLEHFWLRDPEMSPARLSKILRARGITGLILASHGLETGDSLELDWENFSCVKIDYYPHRPLVHNVTNNQSGIVRMAMRKVMEAGYRRIGMVMHRGWDQAVDRNWTAGYLCEQQIMKEKDRVPALIYPTPNPVDRWLKEYDESLVPAQAEFEKWLARHKPEVILSNSKFVGPLLKSMNLKVPKDICFVDLFLSDFSGAVAGARQNYSTVGALAVELVSGQISHNKLGIPEFPTTTFVEGTWFGGASCPPRS